jgi:hypothetical protein
MKCAYHPEAEATVNCVNCANPLCPNCVVKVGDKVYCQPCIDKAFVKKQKGSRSVKLTIGSILGMVAGVISFLAGISFISAGVDKEFWYESTNWTEIGWGITMIVLGIAATVGSIYALTRKNFGLALAGATCAIIPFWFLGIPALLLVAFSKDDFNLTKKAIKPPDNAQQPLDIFRRD